MCGITAVIYHRNSENPPLVNDLYRGLTQLQHRGFQATGITTLDDIVHTVKGMGVVASVYNKTNLQSLVGPYMGIGHVRYTTTTKEGDAQPYSIDGADHPFLEDGEVLSLAHNGHIKHRKEIRAELESKGVVFESTDCDAEDMLNVFAFFYSKHRSESFLDRLKQSMYDTMEYLNDAYSAVMLIKDKGVMAFCDPHGIKPLSYGIKYDERGKVVSCGFASESIALKKLGYRRVRDVDPGALIFVDNELNRYEAQVNFKGKAGCFFEHEYFARSTTTIEGVDVNDFRYSQGKIIAERAKQIWPHLSPDNAIVTPVPNTSFPFAIAFAKGLGLEFKLGIEKIIASKRIFLEETQQARDEATLDNLEPIRSVVRGKYVIVCDDSIVRGTTLTRLVKMLKTARALGVYCVSATPPIRHPCYNGVDTATYEELIAYNRTEEDVSKEITAPVLYSSEDEVRELFKSLGYPSNNLCMACVTGEYPTYITDNRSFELK